MAKRLFIVDFDRTIFETHAFFEAVKDTLHHTHGLDIDEYNRTWEDYLDDRKSAYDSHAHFQALLGLSADDLEAVIASELGDFTFPDAAMWLSRHHADHIVILSTGGKRYQELKFRHSTPIRDLHKIVIKGNKGELLRRHFTLATGDYDLKFLDEHYDSMTLIDDSAEVFTELGNSTPLQGIRIARPGQRYSDQPSPPHVRQIATFDDLQD